MWHIPASTAYTHVFKAYLSSDHVSEATGKTIAITISKAGAAFGNPNAGATNATEIANGWYKVALDTTDTNTTGVLAIRGTAATIDDMGDRLFVVKATNGGLTALPDAAAEASGGLPTLSAAQASNGTINANVHRWLTGTPNALQSGRVDAYLGAVASGVIAAGSFAANALDAVWSTTTRLLTAGTNIVLAKGTGVTGFNDIAAGAAMTLTSDERTAIANEVEAQIIDETDSEKVLTAITDKIAAVNPDLSGLTLSAIAAQVRTELTPELDHIDADISSRSTYAGADTAGTTTLLARLTSTRAGNLDNLDAAITSRLASGSYMAPDNTSITAIKAKTDQMAFTVSGKINANIHYVNNIAVTGSGTTGDPWGP